MCVYVCLYVMYGIFGGGGGCVGAAVSVRDTLDSKYSVETRFSQNIWTIVRHPSLFLNGLVMNRKTNYCYYYHVLPIAQGRGGDQYVFSTNT